MYFYLCWTSILSGSSIKKNVFDGFGEIGPNFIKTILTSIISALIPILYSWILSCSVAYTLQILGQKQVSPVITALIFNLESVFFVSCDWLVLHELLYPKEILGCCFIFLAIIIAQFS